MVRTIKHENRFKQNDFVSPDRRYAPVYNWIWNGVVTPEETDKQLDEMVSLGIKAVAIIPEPKSFRPNTMPSEMEPDYLTPPYFEAYLHAVKAAKKRKMHMWLYDEGGWPSGGACGKVVLKNPDYCRKYLDKRNVSFKKGDIYTTAEGTYITFDEKGNKIDEGYVFTADIQVTEYYSGYSRFELSGFPCTPDVSQAEATELFINMTHEGYKPYLKKFFGNVITTVFSDEPTAQPSVATFVSFRQELVDAFEKEYGYSILPHLPELYVEKPETEAGARAKIAWNDLCSKFFVKNYLLKEKSWTNENGMDFIGHMNVDHSADTCCTHSGNFNLLRSLRAFDIPGIDVIWRQIFPKKGNTPDGHNNGYFPRYASSAAAQVGSEYALTESFGVYGSGLTFNEMRYVLNYQAVRGINLFNFFGIPYRREGFSMTGELPYFTRHHACYNDLPIFNQYVERLSYIASLGIAANDVALYMPVCDLWAGEDTKGTADSFEMIANRLEDMHIQFDIFDDDVLENADCDALKGGKVTIGNAFYSTIIVPSCKYMPEETKQYIATFIAGGGRTIVVNGTVNIDIAGADYVDYLDNALTVPVILSENTEKIRLGIRKAENGTLYMFFNEKDSDQTFSVLLKGCVLLCVETGRILTPEHDNDAVSLTLKSGELALLWQGESVSAETLPIFTNEITLDGKFKFSPKTRYVIGDMHYITEEINVSGKEISLGDWEKEVGNDFSGSCVYETKFTIPCTSKDVSIDLGDVHYTCETFLNGKSLGVKIMPPYRYEVSPKLLKAENTLTIRVTNTTANEYYYTKSFDKWEAWQLSTYHDIEKEYHKDSLSGGLYGPVKILFN